MTNCTPTHILKSHKIADYNIVRADNTYLYNDKGNVLIDFEAGIWCTALGHCNERINEALIDQIGKVMHLNTKLITNISEILANKLLKLLSHQNGKAVFLSSGSEAVDFGVTISRLVTSRKKLLSFSTSYLSAYNHMRNPKTQKLWEQLDFTACFSCTNNHCTLSCEKLSNIDFNEIAAFVFETGSSSGKVLFAPSKIVELISSTVKEHGGLIVANEVTTGFGRTGRWFGFNHYELKPDIVVLGKALGNGYPISAVIMSRNIADQIEKQNFHYAQSHQNDPLGCRVANEVVDVFIEDNMVQRAQDKGEFFLHQLRTINSPLIKDIRGRGLIIAIELIKDINVENIFDKMLERGFFIGTTPAANVLRFYPALTITKKDITNMCNSLVSVLNETEI